MSAFTLAISCLTSSNLPWFMDLTFPVPMQYCSFQHWTLLPSPITSATGCCFHFGSISSFFLELFLYWSPVAHWAPTDLGSSSFSVLSFCLFVLFMGPWRQEYWVVCHSLFHWTTFCQTSPPWPAHLGLPRRHGLVSLHLPHSLHLRSLRYEFPDGVTNETCIEALVTYITFTSFLSCTDYLMVPLRFTAL